jgi:hypothetical protein
MTGTRDTRAASWSKRVRKWRRWAAEMRDLGQIEVVLPEDIETPPHKRIGGAS